MGFLGLGHRLPGKKGEGGGGTLIDFSTGKEKGRGKRSRMSRMIMGGRDRERENEKGRMTRNKLIRAKGDADNPCPPPK